MDPIALSLPETQTMLTVLAALVLGAFTVALALSCKTHDAADD